MPYFFVSYSPSFVVRIPPAKGFSLWLAIFCRTFAVAFEMQRRVKAVAQHSSSKLDSAFALHFICPANKTTALTSTLATGKQKSNN